MAKDTMESPMEASEIAKMPGQGDDPPALHRVDLDLVRARLSADTGRTGGLARLELMLNTILPRLTRTDSK